MWQNAGRTENEQQFMIYKSTDFSFELRIWFFYSLSNKSQNSNKSKNQRSWNCRCFSSNCYKIFAHCYCSILAQNVNFKRLFRPQPCAKIDKNYKSTFLGVINSNVLIIYFLPRKLWKIIYKCNYSILYIIKMMKVLRGRLVLSAKCAAIKFLE